MNFWWHDCNKLLVIFGGGGGYDFHGKNIMFESITLLLHLQKKKYIIFHNWWQVFIALSLLSISNCYSLQFSLVNLILLTACYRYSYTLCIKVLYFVTWKSGTCTHCFFLKALINKIRTMKKMWVSISSSYRN